MIAMHAFFLWSMRGRILRGDPDFTAFYTAGRMLRLGQGAAIYEPAAQQEVQRGFASDSDVRQGPLRYIHPPFEAVLFWPLAFLSYPRAFVVWDLVNLGMIVAVSVVLQRTLLVSLGLRMWEVVLALFAFFPVFVNFFQGQDAILLLLLVVFAFRTQAQRFSRNQHKANEASQSRSDFLAGCWLGLGLFRYHLVIPLVVILALWRRWKILFTFAVTGWLLFLISVGIVGWQAALRYPAYVWHWSSTPGLGRTPPALLPNLLGLVTGWPGLESALWVLRLGGVVASIGLLIVVARMAVADKNPKLSGLSLACAILTTVLIAYNTSTYDLLLLVLPLALVAHYCFQESLDQRAALALVLPAMPLLVSPLWFLIGIYWQKFNLMSLFLLWWLYAIRREILRVERHTEAQRTLSLA
jgi:hypothetical protein